MKLQIIRPIQVKARVTEGLKVRLAAELQDAIRQIDAEMNELDSQAKRATLTATTLSPQQQLQLRQLVESEKQKRNAEKQELLERIKQVGDLPLGSEISQGTVNATAEVGVGDDWDRLFKVEVLVEDGKVVAVRRG